jgi:HTH-type transcriptional regulator/antitoxin HipB
VTAVELYADWGRRVRDAREARGWRQAELARRAGLKQQAISKVERGATGAADDTRIRIAAALELRVQDLFPYPEPVAS